MDILFHVSTAGGGHFLLPLAQSCKRVGCTFGAFFTHEGVLGLKDAALQAALESATQSVVCEESWHRFCGELPCPVEQGSQTANSAMMGDARRVVSL
ncbi:MAG: hypothetical protein K8H75_17040 [Sulfuricella sp.]|nr:hypothetical protein [Sulfuricella sp.]